jgi:hypothetical protein
MPAGMFVPAERYVRLVAEASDPEVASGGFAGLWIEVRCSLTNGERANLLERLAELDREREEIIDRYKAEAERLEEQTGEIDGVANPIAWLEKRKAVDRILNRMAQELERLRQRRPALLAPYIRAWNLCQVDDDGYPPVPPPAEAGPEVFEFFPATAMAWLERQVLDAYRQGKKPGNSLLPPNGTPGLSPESSATTPNGSSEDSP